MLNAYHPAWGNTVNYSLTRLPDSPDAQVAVTIAEVIRLIKEDAQSPIIREIAQRCGRGGDPVAGVWRHVKQLRFAQDFDTAQELDTPAPWKEDVVEVLIRPIDQAQLAAAGNGTGDCDCFQLYGLCLLTALGIPAALVTVSAAPERPREYSHVYGVAYLNGQRIPLDFSHGPHIGWECPNLGRLREWPIDESTGTLVIRTGAILAIAYASYWAITKWSEA